MTVGDPAVCDLPGAPDEETQRSPSQPELDLASTSPEAMIEAFERYVRENMNSVPALIAATQRPRELTRKDLKALAVLLDDKGFSETSLRTAYGRARNADIAAHIIGFIRQAALGDPLVPYPTRVDNPVPGGVALPLPGHWQIPATKPGRA